MLPTPKAPSTSLVAFHIVPLWLLTVKSFLKPKQIQTFISGNGSEAFETQHMPEMYQSHVFIPLGCYHDFICIDEMNQTVHFVILSFY